MKRKKNIAKKINSLKYFIQSLKTKDLIEALKDNTAYNNKNV